MEEKLSCAVDAARIAGAIQRKYFGSSVPIKYKKSLEAVSAVDIESDNAIIDAILARFPDHNILSEERGLIDNGSDTTWVVDPLDGSRNFLHGLPLYGVSIGIKVKGKVKAGVIYLPAADKLYTAVSGKGAYLGEEKIILAGREKSATFIIYDDQLYTNNKTAYPLLKKLAGDENRMRMLGCAVWTYALLAEGGADAFIEFRNRPWDCIAGCLLVEEAGGVVTDLKGNPWTPKSSTILAGNRETHKKMMELITDLI